MFSNIYVTLKLPWDTPMPSASLFASVYLGEHSYLYPFVRVVTAWLHVSDMCFPSFGVTWGSIYTHRTAFLCLWGFLWVLGEPLVSTFRVLWPKCTSCDWGQLPDQGLWSKSSMLAFVLGEQPLSNPSCVPLVLLSPGHWGFWLQTRMRMKPIRKSLWDVDLWGLFVCGLTLFILACPVLLKSWLPWVVVGALGSQCFCFDWKSLPCYYQMEHMGVLWPCFANTFQVSAQYRELLLRPCFSASVLASSVTSAFFGCRMEFAAKNQ